MPKYAFGLTYNAYLDMRLRCATSAKGFPYRMRCNTEFMELAAREIGFDDMPLELVMADAAIRLDCHLDNVPGAILVSP